MTTNYTALNGLKLLCTGFVMLVVCLSTSLVETIWTLFCCLIRYVTHSWLDLLLVVAGIAAMVAFVPFLVSVFWLFV